MKRRLLHLIHSVISRFWVRPLEDRIIPILRKKSGGLSKRLLGWASWLANIGRVIVNEMRLVKKRWISPEWSLTYIGSGESAELLCYHLFPMPPEELEASRVFLWQLPALVRKHTGAGDLVVCELNKCIHLSTKEIDLAFTTPDMVTQIIHGIDRPLEVIMADFRTNIRKQIRKLESQGFSYNPTHSEADFNLFYHRMYLPYIQTRHSGRSAILRDFELVHSIFKDGVLLQIKKDKEFIAGGVCQLNGDICKGYHMGVLDGRVDLLKLGSNVALWWASLLWGRQQGARHINLGTSIPITANGVFSFKSGWGARVHPEEDTNIQLSFFGSGLPTRLRNHLNSLGFLTEKDGNLYQVSLQDPAEPTEEGNLTDQLFKLASCGVAGVIKIYVDGSMETIQTKKDRNLISSNCEPVNNTA